MARSLSPPPATQLPNRHSVIKTPNELSTHYMGEDLWPQKLRRSINWCIRNDYEAISAQWGSSVVFFTRGLSLLDYPSYLCHYLQWGYLDGHFVYLSPVPHIIDNCVCMCVHTAVSISTDIMNLSSLCKKSKTGILEESGWNCDCKMA